MQLFLDNKIFKAFIYIYIFCILVHANAIIRKNWQKQVYKDGRGNVSASELSCIGFLQNSVKSTNISTDLT